MLIDQQETEALLWESMKHQRLEEEGDEEEEEKERRSNGVNIQYTEMELERRHLKDPVVQRRRLPACPSCFVLLAASMASLGGVLFGYDIGIISGAILQLKEQMCLSCFQQELLISIMLFGAMIGSLLGGVLIDKFGRRLILIINALIFVIAAVILACSQNFATLIVGRIVVGFAVAVSATGEIIYISEIAPARSRGLMVSMNELGITIGLLFAYLINFIFIDHQNGWRYMFAISSLPAFFQALGMFFLPMSPRYLMIKGQENQAEEVLRKLRSPSENVEKELAAIKSSISVEQDNRCVQLCSSTDNMRGRMFIGAGLVLFQQFTGQPNVLYYAPMIFEAIGFESHSASTLATVGIGFMKVIMTVMALLCVDKSGRRRFLIGGATAMGLSIFILGVVTHFNSEGLSGKTCSDEFTEICLQSGPLNSTVFKNLTENAVFANASLNGTMVPNIGSVPLNGDLVNGTLGNRTSEAAVSPVFVGSTFRKIVSFVSLLAFVAAYAISFGPVTWLVLSEIFPASIKGRAVGTATVLNWGSNLIVSLTFLDVVNALGVSVTFCMFSGICVLALLFIFLFVPETKGRSLEQISSDLQNRDTVSDMKLRLKTMHCCQGSLTTADVSSSYDVRNEEVDVISPVERRGGE